jgi:hypothetical protein
MTYLETLESELTSAGIPRARRRRIVAEFADHLHDDPSAKLGAPRELARQFADELGTRLARTAAFRAFVALAFAGVALGAMFLAVGRIRGLTIYGQQHTPTPAWAAPILTIAVLASQLALAAGGTALLRAWRLRNASVISAEDATILARRSALGLAGGAVALIALPVCALAFPHAAGSTWTLGAWLIAGVGIAALVSVLPTLLAGVRLRPDVTGHAGDLVDDLGPWARPLLTPLRCALLTAAAIIFVLTVSGIVTSDPYDGALRGIADAVVCMIGFTLLGGYLGLRTSS